MTSNQNKTCRKASNSWQFELPSRLTAENFIAQLNQLADIQVISRDYSLRTYYDSFDWRLWKAGILCEFNRSKTRSLLTLRNPDTGLIIGSTELADVPEFPDQLKDETIRSILQDLLETRALLPICTIDFMAHHLSLYNEDKKTILRLVIEDYDLYRMRLLLQPIKGYERAAENLVPLLTEDLGLMPTSEPLLLAALEMQGRKPVDYSSKLDIRLEPGMTAEAALKTIFRRLLKAIKVNEQGTIAGTDIEFLHDFRVAVRRTRTALSQLKNSLPDDIYHQYADFFSWLGKSTSPARDLDVYLYRFERGELDIPAAIREELTPFYNFLVDRKKESHQELANILNSTQYKKTLLTWEQYLKQISDSKPAAAKANIPVKELADQKIRKLYKRVLKEGEAITPESPAADFHSLRKTCKKLRYLIEFFQSLYPEKKIKKILKALKGLQQVLGNFQDFEVQERIIKSFSEEKAGGPLPPDTVSAVHALMESIDTSKENARQNYFSRFQRFKKDRIRSAFKSLFSNDNQ
ncbi:MAG: CHAD domain-containing protein [Gammaproteobacteria bacterium]